MSNTSYCNLNQTRITRRDNCKFPHKFTRYSTKWLGKPLVMFQVPFKFPHKLQCEVLGMIDSKPFFPTLDKHCLSKPLLQAGFFASKSLTAMSIVFLPQTPTYNEKLFFFCFFLLIVGRARCK